MRKSVYIVLPMLFVTLIGCEQLPEFQEAAKGNKSIRTESELAKTGLANPNLKNEPKLPGVVHTGLPYVDFSKTVREHGEELPSATIGTGRIAIPFPHALAFDEVVSHIQHYTNIEVEIMGDITNDKGQRPHDAKPFYPVAGLAVKEGEGIVWQGQLDVMLNQFTRYYGYDWYFKDGRLYIVVSQTRLFNLNVLKTKPSYNTDISTETSGSDDGSSTSATRQSVKIEEYKLDIWSEVKTQMDELLLKEWGQARYSESTGTIIVEGRPADIKAVRNYLKVMNEERLRLVSIGIRVINYSSSLNGDYDFSLSSFIEDAIGNKNFAWQAGPGGNSIGIVRNLLPGQNEGTLNATLTALSSKGEVSSRFTGSAVSLGDYPIPIQNLRQQYIVDGVSQTNTDGTAQNAVSTSILSTGTFFTAIARVIQGNQILVDLSLGIKDILGKPTRTVGTTEIDLPETGSSNFKNSAVLQSGDTLVLAGFLDESNSRNNEGTGVPENIFLGGAAEAEREKTTQILLLTAEILPPFQLTETEGVMLR